MILINSKLLKDFSPIPLNFDTKEVENYVSIAAQIWIQPVIGDDLYDELITQVEENKVSDENSTLLIEAVYPLLGFAVCLEALPFIWSHVSQVGITLGKSDNSDSLSLKDLNYVENHLRRQVEYRKDYLYKWLDEHYESFPLYHPTNCSCNVCNSNTGKLNKPNPYWIIYSTKRQKTDIN